MKRRLTILCLCVVVFAPAILGFKCGGSSTPPPTGFRIRTLFIVRSPLGVDILRRGVPALIAGNWQFDTGAANGTVTSFNSTTDAGGRYTVTNGRVPANWLIIRGPIPPCTTISGPVNVTPGQEIETGCIVLTVSNLTSSPNPVNSQTAPQGFTVNGSGFNTTYGMPKVEYFNDYGDFVGVASAASVTSSAMSGTMPDLTNLYDGTYTMLISNATAVGWEAVGYTTVQTYGNPEPPPGGCGASETMLPILCRPEPLK